MGESTPLLISEKTVLDEEQQSPWTEGSPNRVRVVEGGSSGKITPFKKILIIFSSHLPCTLEDPVFIVLTSDLYFIHNLYAGDKMELAS